MIDKADSITLCCGLVELSLTSLQTKLKGTYHVSWMNNRMVRDKEFYQGNSIA